MADKIKELLAMDDAGLSALLGVKQKITDMREGLQELDKLSGDARKEALDRVNKMFEPRVWPEEFGYIADDIEREQKVKKSDNETGNDLLDPEMYPDLED